MALVQEYKIGNTKIKIHDDAYKDKTKNDIDRILARVAHIASTSLNGTRQKSLKRKEK
ncbi:MAG: hypothetical protein ACOX7L_07495 [Dethiobacteria bacterium]